MAHSFGLFVALKQNYLAEIYKIPKFLLYKGKFNRAAVGIITMFTFWKSRPRYDLFSILRKNRLKEKEENYYSFFVGKGSPQISEGPALSRGG